MSTTEAKRPPAAGHTRIGIAPTRAPADSPAAAARAAASSSAAVARLALGGLRLTAGELAAMMTLARRGAALLARDMGRGARLVRRLCVGLDQAAGALLPLLQLDVPRAYDDLGRVLGRLAEAEAEIAAHRRDAEALRRNVAFERRQNDELRAALAEARAGEPGERFAEPTRNRPLTEAEKTVVDDPDAAPARHGVPPGAGT